MSPFCLWIVAFFNSLECFAFSCYIVLLLIVDSLVVVPLRHSAGPRKERKQQRRREGRKGCFLVKGWTSYCSRWRDLELLPVDLYRFRFQKAQVAFFFLHVFLFFNLRFLRALLFTSFCWPILYAFCDSISSLHPCTLAPYFFSVPDAYILLRASLSALHFDNLVCRLSTSLNAPFW